MNDLPLHISLIARLAGVSTLSALITLFFIRRTSKKNLFFVLLPIIGISGGYLLFMYLMSTFVYKVDGHFEGYFILYIVYTISYLFASSTFGSLFAYFTEYHPLLRRYIFWFSLSISVLAIGFISYQFHTCFSGVDGKCIAWNAHGDVQYCQKASNPESIQWCEDEVEHFKQCPEYIHDEESCHTKATTAIKDLNRCLHNSYTYGIDYLETCMTSIGCDGFDGECYTSGDGKKYCGDEVHYEIVEKCSYAAALETSQESVCDNLPDLDTSESSFTDNTRSTCLTNFAKEKRDKSICDSINFENAKSECIRYVERFRVVEERDIAHCPRLYAIGSDYVDACTAFVIACNEPPDPTLCKSASDQYYYKTYCWQRYALENNDPSVCSNIAKDIPSLSEYFPSYIYQLEYTGSAYEDCLVFSRFEQPVRSPSWSREYLCGEQKSPFTEKE